MKKYGLNMLVTADDQVKAYLKRIMAQLHNWMQTGTISRLVVVIASKETGEPVERWQFDVQATQHRSSSKEAGKAASKDKENADPTAPQEAKIAQKEKAKTEKEIQDEIQAIFRQITASVTFLPQLDGACTFNVLVYADAASAVPLEWGDSDAREVVGGERVQLRSFSTSNHKVETLVSYRMVD